MSATDVLESLPLLPLKGTVLFAHMEQPVVVGRPRSVAAVEAALKHEDKHILVTTQRDGSVQEPQVTDLHAIGTLAYIHRLERQSDGVIGLVLRGLERVRLTHLDDSDRHLRATFDPLPLPDDYGETAEALHRDVMDQARKLEELMGGSWPRGFLDHMQQALTRPIEHVYALATLLKLDAAQQQAIHETDRAEEALRVLHEALGHELQILALQQEIASQTASTMSAQQRRYFLRQQLETIQKELGEDGEDQGEVDELRSQLDAAGLPADVAKVVDKELGRLRSMSPAAQDYQLLLSWLRLVAELPWQKATEDKLDLAQARHMLDTNHFGLGDVKDRIIEHLAVRKLNPDARSSILCFVGGPGVGKTSLAESIAQALGREFDGISLGGLHDEAELRGHRRTYIGAMPGRVIQAMRRKGVRNPLILLDEIDKLGRDYRGDPSAALMEILDPSQNRTFRDNYLDLPFDLSQVFFVTTANTLDTIPAPLLDRMEVLRLSGYTEEEKLQIARRHLLPAQLRDVGLDDARIALPDEVILHIIRRYTREAGVRDLNRQLARVVRKCAVPFAEGSGNPVTLSREHLPDLLGPERFSTDMLRKDVIAGVATGLAWTEAGGDVLFMEAVKTPGGKGLQLTGQLGDVMKESAQTALSYLWSQAPALGIDPAEFQHNGVHVHVPAGAIPKDGPSAGVTIATALLSLFTGRPMRADTAMTGEISLAGLVLPVGGIKEKVLAARRAGVRRIILPEANLRDLATVDEVVRKELEFIPATMLAQVFAAAFG